MGSGEVRGLINSLLWRDFYRFIVHFAWGNRLFHLYGPTSCGSVPGGHREPTKWCCTPQPRNPPRESTLEGRGKVCQIHLGIFW